MLRRLIRNRKYLPFCFEALLNLLLCKILILLMPFRFYAKKYGVPFCETLREDMSHQADKLMAISLALRVVSKYLPWSKCLDQAMAAQRMLARRKLQSTIYFGIAREKDKALIAHAWVRSGDRWIVGYIPTVAYSIVGVYAWHHSLIKA